MKILFVKLGTPLSDKEKYKIDKAIDDLQLNYLNNNVSNSHITKINIDVEPIFETTDFPQGKLSFLSGQTMIPLINAIDVEDLAPIIVGVVDPQPNLNMANICYKLLREYDIVNCSVVSDKSLEHYIVHELSHAIHELLLRQGISLPDTQDQDIMKAGSPDATRPEHKAIVKQNLLDCLPYINTMKGELPKLNLFVSLLSMVVKLLVILLEKIKGNSLQVYAKEQAIKNGIDHRVLMATIEAESSGDPHAIGFNNNGSKDGGIVQINDYWGIGSNCKASQVGEYYFPSSDYVLQNPKECIDGMINQGVKGRQNDGYAYKNETYKLFLKNY